MNDFDYEVLQKKRIARGAYAMKNGSKSHKCTFPSDFLTAGEKKRLNGEVRVFQMNKPMSRGQFCQLPTDLQKTYLTGLMEKYHPSYVMLGQMFGCTDVTARKICLTLGIRSSVTGKTSGACRERWAKFLNGEDEDSNVSVETAVEEQPAEEPVIEEPREESEETIVVRGESLDGKSDTPLPDVEMFSTVMVLNDPTPSYLKAILENTCFPKGRCRLTLTIEKV